MVNYSYEDNKVVFKAGAVMETLYVIGSFTNWKIIEEFKMNKKGDCFILEIGLEEVKKLGNSGYPEYYFGNENEKLEFDKSYKIGYFFNNQSNSGYNYLLLPESMTENRLKEISMNNADSFRIKNKPEEFKNHEELSNFRTVTGGNLGDNRLYRSYHPVIPSREEDLELKDIELIRQNALRDIIEKNGIKNVINLSETYEELKEYLEKEQPTYYKKLFLDGAVCNVPMSYETVYFMSDRNESFKRNELGFRDGIKKIIEFISENKGPYLVHCRLGSDRTGVVSAFLQLFMDASKEEISSNYLKTNNLGIGEYRSFNLLEFSLKNAFGINCFEENGVKEYLTGIGLKEETIEKAYSNLKAFRLNEDC